MRDAFAAFDEDGDGFLDARDVGLFFEALGERLEMSEVNLHGFAYLSRRMQAHPLPNLTATIKLLNCVVQVRALIAQVDADGDGRVSFSEFFEMANRSTFT